MSPSSLAGHVVELLDMIVKSNSPADRVVSDFCRKRRYLGAHDRRWITDRIYGILRNLILLREIGKDCAPGREALVTFLLYEILIIGMKPDEIRTIYSQLLDAYKLAGEGVDADRLSADSLRKFAALNESRNEAIMNSFPDFFCELLSQKIRNECTPIMKALNREARVCVRVDTSKISRQEALNSFRSREIDAYASKFSPLGIYLPKRVNLNNFPLYQDGKIEVQEEASQLAGLIVSPQKDEIIVDACAGAGGKSLEFASLSAGQSSIYALDIDRERLENLKSRAMRSEYTDIVPRVVSGQNLDEVRELIGAADKVVVDAPCSGSGTIRRNPDKKFKMTKASVEKKALYQGSLLKDYSRMVKVGGMLYYVTCSIFEIENQSVVKSFLDSNVNFRLMDVSEVLPQQEFYSLIEDGFLSIYPHRCEMDGFFVAAMERLR
jgi:16S rRNA (cytosine967-C5)-methyltransferase